MADDYLMIRDRNRAKTGALMERSGYSPPVPTPRPPYERDTQMDEIERNNYDIDKAKRFRNDTGKPGDDRLSDAELLYHSTNPAGRLGGVADQKSAGGRVTKGTKK